MVGKSFRDLLTIRLTLPSVIMMPKKSMNKNLMEMTALFKRTKLLREKYPYNYKELTLEKSI